jgi:uncharacterized NAD(P)/FAD-binding protein YdhS/mannose-6-phosphate isomerase-like protein (cupin superfamily)
MSSLNLESLEIFFNEKYSRNLVFKTDNLEVILMGWLPGQGTDLHTHGASDAVSMVVSGEMTCITHHQDGTKVRTVLKKGDVELVPVGIAHEVRNNSTRNLVTLHIYSPPLSEEELKVTLGYNNEVVSESLTLEQKNYEYLVGCVPDDLLKLLKAKEKRQKTITIIGGGFSGTLVATQLMNQNFQDEELQIILIERASKFARGFAYSTNSPHHLLNVPASNMSAFPNEPDHFLKWAQNRDSSIQSQSFVPRMMYGEYLEYVLYNADQDKSKKVKFKRINDDAIRISVDDKVSKATVHLESGISLETDAVVLAVGNYPPKNLHIGETSFFASTRYVRDPWSQAAIKGIEEREDVLLIGTGLTMVDKAIELNFRKHKGKILALSRHGLIPHKHNLKAGVATIDPSIFKNYKSLRELFNIIRKQLNLFITLGGDWRAYLDGLRPYIQTLWQDLSEKDRKQFFRHLRPYWDIHRHRTPEDASLILESMSNFGQLEIIAGRINSFEEINNSVKVTYRPRGSKELREIKVSKVINCTGSEQDFCQIEDPLIINLLQQGIIQSDSMSLGLKANKEGALICADGKASTIFSTLGPPLKGQLWETTAVPEIRLQAQKLAERLITNLKAVHRN